MKNILKELPELVTNGVITPATAQNIEAYYTSKKAPHGSSFLAVFGIIGAALTGLGIILIFAHNWDTFTKNTKTLLALLPLIVFQGLTAYALITKKTARWTEPAGVLLFFAVGASMALIAQIYNIPGNLAGYLCTWTLLCLPLVYILRSNALAVLHIVFSTYYAFETGFGSLEKPWMYLFFIAALMPFYINRLRRYPTAASTSFLNLLLPISCTICLGFFLDYAYKFNVAIYIAFFGLLYTISLLPALRRNPMHSGSYGFLSQFGIVVLLLVTSSKWYWEFHADKLDFSMNTLPLGIIFLALSLYLALWKAEGQKRFDPFLVAIFSFPVIYLTGFAAPHTATILINLLVLGLGIAIIRNAAQEYDLRRLNLGLLVIAALIISRFFDTYMSFAIRGLMFVIVGLGFFFANYILIRKKKDHEITK